MEPYLRDQTFLKTLCSSKYKITFARITILSQDELPIEQIEGTITSGSINIDGASAVRRTCSLSMVVKDKTVDDYLLYFKRKIKLEIGLENTLNQYIEYPIIWFPMGIYLIATCNLSVGNNGQLTINLTGKDKMCQLNGELGGIIDAETDFGTIEEYDELGFKTIKKLPVKQIIKDILHTYAGEKFAKIFLEDIDNYGLNLETYRGNFPMYFFIGQNASLPANYTFNGNTVVYSNNKKYLLKNLTRNELLPSGIDIYNGTHEYPKFKIQKNDNKEYYIKKIEYGETAGYKLIELVYPSDLIAKPGETIVNVLDKIKIMLGDFEYFYDLDGNFIFRKQKAYREINNLIKDNNQNLHLITDYANNIDFTFDDLELISSFSNTPNIANVKNDFAVWGNRPSGGGNGQVPIHMRYAIDTKPIEYTSIYIDNERVKVLKNYKDLFLKLPGETDNDWNDRIIASHPKVIYSTIQEDRDANIQTGDCRIRHVDWRELIYQMAKDYRAFNQLDEFEIWLKESNPLCLDGKTGYEQYYTDLEGFWRQLYRIDKNIFQPYREKFQEGRTYKFAEQANIANGQDLTYSLIPKDNTGNDYSDKEIYWLESITENEDGTYTPNFKNLGTLSAIINTNYNILQRQIERLNLVDIMHSNSELFDKLKTKYNDAKIKDVLFFKDPRTMVPDGNTGNWISPKDKNLLYHGFQEPYFRAKNQKENNVYPVYATYMSASKTAEPDGTSLSMYDNIKNKHEKWVIENLYNLGEATLENGNISTMFNPIENTDFEWFIKYSDSYVSLGHYYPLNNDTWLTTPLRIENKTFNRLYFKEDATDNTATGVAIDDLATKITQDGYTYFSDLNNILDNSHMNFANIIPWKNIWTTPGWASLNNRNYATSLNGANDTQQILYLMKMINFLIPELLTYQEDGFNENTYWRDNILECAETLNFWFDFLDTTGDISKYSVKEIGQKFKIASDNTVKAIKYGDTMLNIFIDPTDKLFNTEEKAKQYFSSADQKTGYVYFNLGSNFANYLSLSSQGKDAFSVIENWLYNYAYCSESISINTIPLYFLEPNTKFQISDPVLQSVGIYILSKISINMGNNSTMGLTATRAIENNITRKEILKQ